MSMTISDLQHVVANASMIRLSVDLSPLTPDGLVYPPTYAALEKKGPPHIDFRKGWVDGVVRNVVVLDSVQSQANRVEQAILSARQDQRLAYPDIRLSFPDDAAEAVYSVLQLSHRIFDVALQCATLDQQPFFETEAGQRLRSSRPSNATALFELAPLTLLLGAWDSHGGGVQAAKLPRLLTSEIIGLDAELVSISAMKSDPMDIRSNAAELVDAPAGSGRLFELKKAGAKEKSKKPSEFGFGNVPAVNKPRAASISSARQTSLLSCSGLRQLYFPGGKVGTDAVRDLSARTVLAALGLYGLLAQNEAGYRLRSRCELVPLAAGRLEVIGRTLQEVKTFDLGADEALLLLHKALVDANEQGLRWGEDLELSADDRLVELVRRSRIAVGGSDDTDA
ncbi:MAG: type I-U CRISPR-associated RAMP protein Csb1/Cas7u [Candidatus Accumulibacter sp. UW26]|jgi:CRISPR-associated protein Csb1